MPGLGSRRRCSRSRSRGRGRGRLSFLVRIALGRTRPRHTRVCGRRRGADMHPLKILLKRVLWHSTGGNVLNVLVWCPRLSRRGRLSRRLTRNLPRPFIDCWRAMWLRSWKFRWCPRPRWVLLARPRLLLACILIRSLLGSRILRLKTGQSRSASDPGSCVSGLNIRSWLLTGSCHRCLGRWRRTPLRFGG